jgi:hypothetical protein
MIVTSEKIKQHRQRAAVLRQEQASYREHWRTIAEYMLPRRGKYLSEDSDNKEDQGSRKDGKIINGSAVDAVRVVAAGLQGGLTSPSRPWFLPTFADTDLMEYAPVREWLHRVRNILLTICARSNFYTSTHNVYTELAGFGTGCMMTEENFQTGIRCRTFTIGEYVIYLDASYRPVGMYRRYSSTAEQMVQKFGLANVSFSVQQAYKDFNKDKSFEIQHCIQPSTLYDPAKADYRSMSFESIYFESAGGDDAKPLRVSGYRGIPFAAPRWSVSGVNTYGDSPAMDAIGDVKMLQKLEEKKLKKIDKHVEPPMNAPLALKAKGGSIISGGVNYYDVNQGGQQFAPAYQVDGNVDAIAREILTVEGRIRKYFFNDLFLTVIAQEGGPQKTAYEIAKKYEEKLMMLGPIIEQFQSEFHDVKLDRIYAIADNMGLIPPAPREIQGMEMKMEYIGLLAQAQKMVGMASVEQTANFVGALAPLYPDVLDKFDADQAVDEYSAMNGTPPKLIVSDADVEKKRQARAQQQQMQQALAAAGPAADAAKKLSDAKVEDNNALGLLAKRGKGAAR